MSDCVQKLSTLVWVSCARSGNNNLDVIFSFPLGIFFSRLSGLTEATNLISFVIENSALGLLCERESRRVGDATSKFCGNSSNIFVFLVSSVVSVHTDDTKKKEQKMISPTLNSKFKNNNNAIQQHLSTTKKAQLQIAS